MKRILFLLVMASLVSAIGCKREPNIIVDPPPPPFSYFKFRFEGTSHHLWVDLRQYMPLQVNEVGGYQVADSSLKPSLGLKISWPAGDTVSENDVITLPGKTLYFSNPILHPTLIYSAGVGVPDWLSVDTNHSTYNIKIMNIVPFKKDTVAGTPLKTYVIKGTCNALMSRSGTLSIFSDGEFNFVIARRDL